MRIREFRHLFSTTRRIVATIHIDLDRARVSPGDMGCGRCEWEGSRERQPSAKLYPEYKQWIDGIYRWLSAELGSRHMCALETPDGFIEIWLYAPGEPPRFAELLPNPTNKPLSEALLGLPRWDESSG